MTETVTLELQIKGAATSVRANPFMQTLPRRGTTDSCPRRAWRAKGIPFSTPIFTASLDWRRQLRFMVVASDPAIGKHLSTGSRMGCPQMRLVDPADLPGASIRRSGMTGEPVRLGCQSQAQACDWAPLDPQALVIRFLTRERRVADGDPFPTSCPCADLTYGWAGANPAMLP